MDNYSVYWLKSDLVQFFFNHNQNAKHCCVQSMNGGKIVAAWNIKALKPAILNAC